MINTIDLVEGMDTDSSILLSISVESLKFFKSGVFVEGNGIFLSAKLLHLSLMVCPSIIMLILAKVSFNLFLFSCIFHIHGFSITTWLLNNLHSYSIYNFAWLIYGAFLGNYHF